MRHRTQELAVMCTQGLPLRRIGSIHSHLARRPRCSVCQRDSSMRAYFDYPNDLGDSTVRRHALTRQRMAPKAQEPWHCSVRTSLSRKTVGFRNVAVPNQPANRVCPSGAGNEVKVEASLDVLTVGVTFWSVFPKAVSRSRRRFRRCLYRSVRRGGSSSLCPEIVGGGRWCGLSCRPVRR